MTVAPNKSMFVVLQWNDPYGQPVNDFRLGYCDAQCSQASLIVTPKSSQVSVQFAELLNPGAVPRVFNIAVFYSCPCTQTAHVELFVIGPSHGAGKVNNYLVAGDSVFGHAAAPGVLATAAIDAQQQTLPHEDFSDQGPSTIFFPTFVQRMKPDVTATDGVSVTGAGGFGQNIGGKFCSTVLLPLRPTWLVWRRC